MNSLFKIKIELITMAIDYPSGLKYVLSIDDEIILPCAYIDQDILDINQALDHISQMYIDLDFSWMNPKFITNIIDHKTKEVTIVYGSLVPLDTKLLFDARWLMAYPTTKEAMFLADRSLFES